MPGFDLGEESATFFVFFGGGGGGRGWVVVFCRVSVDWSFTLGTRMLRRYSHQWLWPRNADVIADFFPPCRLSGGTYSLA